MEKKALVFNIQRYSVHDGPGIRTLIFFKGCPMRCKWCANPEGISRENQVKFVRTACVGCGACIRACPTGAAALDDEGSVTQNAEACIRCGVCIDACPAKSRLWWGTEFSAAELFRKAMRDKGFFKATGGGLSLGGGDPLLQHEFTLEFLKLCKENDVNTAVETGVLCPFDILAECASFCNTLFTDLKAWQPAVHKELVGVDNSVVLGNLSALNQWLEGRQIRPEWIIRLPFLPEVNFFSEDMESLADYLRSLQNLTAVEVLPFHNLGEYKYAQTGLPYEFLGASNLRKEDVEPYAAVLRRKGIAVTITDW